MRSIFIGLLAAMCAGVRQTTAQLAHEGPMPSLSGSTWINSKPLTTSQLRGKVVLIDFWTYSCVNCLRSLPYVKAWDAKYRNQGLVVIGVHAPEFDFEHDVANVRRSVKALGITYPVVLDNGMKIWDAFHNQYWPAHYFIDRKGEIRYHHFGEGGYDESERIIRELLADDGVAATRLGADTTGHIAGAGVLAAADMKNVRSPETYVGYGRGARFMSPQRVRRDTVTTYTTPSTLALNQWALAGAWRVGRQFSASAGRSASVTFRFHARDLHLVLGSATAGQRVKFRVTIDGRAPGSDAGMDVDANGNGVITNHRLYQLVRQRGAIRDRTFVITFESPGAQVYAFTFG